jgi:hypothetical protein
VQSTTITGGYCEGCLDSSVDSCRAGPQIAAILARAVWVLAVGAAAPSDHRLRRPCASIPARNIDITRGLCLCGDVSFDSKRGLLGTFQHMDKNHLDRYLAKFDFRMNTCEKLGINDTQRAAIAVQGFKGKRLTYRRPGNEA